MIAGARASAKAIYARQTPSRKVAPASLAVVVPRAGLAALGASQLDPGDVLDDDQDPAALDLGTDLGDFPGGHDAEDRRAEVGALHGAGLATASVTSRDGYPHES